MGFAGRLGQTSCRRKPLAAVRSGHSEPFRSGQGSLAVQPSPITCASVFTDGSSAPPHAANRIGEVPSVSTPTNKRSRTLSSCSSEAVALGYEHGTIKHAAYVLLTRAGDAGLTVSSIVECATREGMYSWGTCKTPNNSVTAALSQDQNFSRVAPSTYALRTQHLRPVGAAAARESRHAASVSSAGERAATDSRAPSHHNLRSTRESRGGSRGDCDQPATSDDSTRRNGDDYASGAGRGPSSLRIDPSEKQSRGPLSRTGSYLASPLLSTSRRRDSSGAAAPAEHFDSDGQRGADSPTVPCAASLSTLPLK